MAVGERFGLALLEMTKHEVEAYHRRNPSPVPHLPFGHCSVDQVLEFTRLQYEDPGWFNRRIHQATPPDTEVLIIDSPPMVSTWTREIINTADFVLVVLSPDGASYSTIPATQEILSETTRPHGEAYLVNRMDARPGFSRDVRAGLENFLGDKLLPFTIPADEAFREALGRQLSIHEHAPNSHALARLNELDGWLVRSVIDA